MQTHTYTHTHSRPSHILFSPAKSNHTMTPSHWPPTQKGGELWTKGELVTLVLSVSVLLPLFLSPILSPRVNNKNAHECFNRENAPSLKCVRAQESEKWS